MMLLIFVEASFCHSCIPSHLPTILFLLELFIKSRMPVNLIKFKHAAFNAHLMGLCSFCMGHCPTEHLIYQQLSVRVINVRLQLPHVVQTLSTTVQPCLCCSTDLIVLF